MFDDGAPADEERPTLALPLTDKLFEQLYDELRVVARRYMARERADHTLQPTALVNEAYLNLTASLTADIADRTHFLRLAARKMRHILVDHARGRSAARRGGGMQRVTLSDGLLANEPEYDLMDLDDALNQLEKLHEEHALVIDLRYIVGLTVEEVATELGLSPRTVKEHTRFAKAWLRQQLS